MTKEHIKFLDDHEQVLHEHGFDSIVYRESRIHFSRELERLEAIEARWNKIAEADKDRDLKAEAEFLAEIEGKL